ncbi:MAG: HAMP domain-containing histidine kinase [bacterium]|nr:HAMP domain-containing histidine kinase [bacterium]
MKTMFESATLKLTVWYIAILMTISIVFSTVIYQVSISEVNARLESLRDQISQSAMLNVSDDYFQTFAITQSQDATQSIIMGLVYVNIFIFIAGTMGCYALARFTLLPVEKAHENQSRFVSNASHELKTPLASIKAENEVILRDKKATKDDLKDVIKSNLEEVDRLSVLSHMLLQLSSQSNLRLDKSKVNLSKSIREMVSSRQASTGSHIALTKPRRDISINANKPAIDEIANILVDNALKYSDNKTAVQIKLSRSRKYAKMYITNSGPTISPSDIDRIFDRFYRGDSSRSTSGYGLGLSLAKQLVDRHNGSIGCSSAKNKTTFTVSLPLYS